MPPQTGFQSRTRLPRPLFGAGLLEFEAKAAEEEDLTASGFVEKEEEGFRITRKRRREGIFCR